MNDAMPTPPKSDKAHKAESGRGGKAGNTTTRHMMARALDTEIKTTSNSLHDDPPAPLAY